MGKYENFDQLKYFNVFLGDILSYALQFTNVIIRWWGDGVYVACKCEGVIWGIIEIHCLSHVAHSSAKYTDMSEVCSSIYNPNKTYHVQANRYKAIVWYYIQ